jgi:diguanylate cyclase (GGDEF)-like protein
MKSIQIILNSILSKNIFEYILLNKTLDILSTSDTVDIYLEKIPQVGEDILHYLPELVGVEDSIKEILENPTYRFILESVYKNGYYVNIFVEHYDEGTLLLLIHNITDIALSKQKLLQYSNESLLLNKTLQKILDNQNSYLFVTHNEEIAFANKKFMEYFKASTIKELRQKKLDIYKYLDHILKSYDALFERVNSKEEYIIINNDTFILQASNIESTHKLFTLTKITNLSNKLQYDPLTSAYKKDFFNKELEKLILLNEKGAVVVLDLDNFKNINDAYGYQVGDEVLKEFSLLIQENIRAEDIFARWGGEEFLLLLKHTNVEEAEIIAQKICNLIDNHLFKDIGHLTSSLGLACISEKDTLHSVLFRADKALYDAKKSGKNNVVVKMLKK